MYLTYAEYQSMGGTLDQTSFDNFEFEAEAVVNWYTFNRLKNDTQFPEEVKKVIKYLISVAEQKASLLNPSTDGSSGISAGIASQSNDGVSISYNVLNASELMKDLKESEGETVKRYLQGVMNEAGRKLLYRGVYPGE